MLLFRIGSFSYMSSNVIANLTYATGVYKASCSLRICSECSFASSLVLGSEDVDQRAYITMTRKRLTLQVCLVAAQEVAHILSVSALAVALGTRRADAGLLEVVVEALKILASLVFDLVGVVGVVDRSLVAASDVVGVLSVYKRPQRAER